MAKTDKLNLHGKRIPRDSSYALFVDPDNEGRVELVEAQGFEPDKNARAFRDTDRGHLACVHCDTPMSYAAAKKSIAGSSGNREIGYFFAQGPHEDSCLLHDPDTVHNFVYLDPDKGPRININTVDFSADFTDAAGVYHWKNNVRYLSDDDLLDRPVKEVTHVKDVLKLIDNHLRAQTIGKLADARFVFRNHAQNWNETIIRLGTPARHADLVKRVMARPLGSSPPYAVIEIKTTDEHDARPRLKDPKDTSKTKQVPPAPVDLIEIGTIPETGEKVYVQYGIYLDSNQKQLQEYGMREPGTYFVMGEVRGNHFHNVKGEDGQPGHRIYYLNMKITDHRQIIKAGTEEVLEKSKLPRPRRSRPIGPTADEIYPLHE